ncbi:HD domain-containing protein [Staphylococcus intermedius]|uniref:HD domain-containing protein n=1 Tax=Staphylococcus intermedius NCTC 11048 TaxID=1141106 RepID=A0A380G5W2_STAIN|nr:HD domain-containing protein [Staphylococcus intermedius]PCF62810.1 phosphohydrolase [Staphylococcus intermedius]PCF77922.1 phosphohydrolase [Staphylococcus intermedius]PCF78274.1 phosphohydrolase [Staphylococcus intermedius]PCF85350.1 phosphohydrolase [Staphylococcus intermedius]PCF86070.1 phosphohydrolase [Staphylococcus intermedius]
MKPHVIQAAEQYMKTAHQHDSSGHDIAHVLRVRKLALKIAQHYPSANQDQIEMASLLHDTVDDKLVDAESARQILSKFLDEQGVSSDDQEAIFYIIDHMSFRKSKTVGTLKTIEAQIVQDADRLDAIGAIGIARTFQFAGHFHEPMWTGAHHLTEMQKMTDLDVLPPSAIKHFFEKLLQLKDLMNTPVAAKMAQQRHAFMESFLQQFFDEWDTDTNDHAQQKG